MANNLPFSKRLFRKACSITDKTARKLSNLLFTPISWAVYGLFSKRYAIIRSHRIGHLAMDTDCCLKQLAMGDPNDAERVTIVMPDESCNPSLSTYWNEYAPSQILTEKIDFAQKLGRIGPTKFPTIYNTGVPANVVCRGQDFRSLRPTGDSVYQVYRQWGDRPPLLKLSETHQKQGESILKKWGISEGDWFVCLHARESGWDHEIDGPDKARRKDFRNSDILSYELAVKTIEEAGGWCVRMGDSSMKQLPPWKRTFDYANSDDKSDWMDLFLCSQAKFFLGTNSGLFGVANVFGIPCALSNLVPMTGMPVKFGDIGISKLLRDRNTNHLLSFPEILSSSKHLSNNQDLYDLWEVDIIDNSAAEINELTKEMLDRLSGSFTESEEDRNLQKTMQGMINERHMCYQLASTFATTFLRRHRDLVSGN